LLFSASLCLCGSILLFEKDPRFYLDDAAPAAESNGEAGGVTRGMGVAVWRRSRIDSQIRSSLKKERTFPGQARKVAKIGHIEP
jgi:hypothetical protein